MRLYYEKKGAHVHCRLFVSGLAGVLVFSEAEWPKVKAQFSLIAEVIEE